MIRQFEIGDLGGSIDLLIATYNREPWNDSWTKESARAYLTEFINSSRFVGFVIDDDGVIVAASFAHARTWAGGNELYIDEFFVSPTHQGKGLGKQLMSAITKYATDLRLADIVLLTDNDKPAFDFYKALGFGYSGRQVLMSKSVKNSIADPVTDDPNTHLG